MQEKKVGLAALLIVATLLSCASLDIDAAPSERASAQAGASANLPRPTSAVGSHPATSTPTRTPPTPTSTASPSPGPAASSTPATGTPDTSTPTTTPTTVPPTQPPAASGYHRHVSQLYPYALDYPQAWQAITGGAISGEARADLFAGEQHGQALSSVTVYSQPVAAETSSRFFADAMLAGLAAAEINPGQEQVRTIAGAEAFVATYTTTHEGQAYAITQAAFVRDGRGWMITLTSAPEESDRLRPVFDHVLASFQAWE